MTLLKKEKFNSLANVHNAHCVSVYLPTHRSGHEVTKNVDQITLKNQLKEVKKQLQSYGLQEEEIKNYLKPIHELLEDDNFWRYQSDGLAIFLYENEFEYFTLPIDFDEFVYVADHLYLKPLVSVLNGNGLERFFIMTLSLGDVKFYEGTPHSIVAVEMEGLIPQSMEEAISVGEDYEQKSLQFRSGQGEQGEAAMYHGHGAGDQTEKKEEILKYFREIDEGVMHMLHDEKAPLLLACVDYLDPIYREANSYRYLFNKHISGNHQNTSMLTLHAQARDILGELFEQDKEKQCQSYQEKVHQGLASYQAEKVIPAAMAGQVDTLVIQKDKKLWGVYNADKHAIEMHDRKRVDNACLLNKAAIETIKKSGKVLLMDKDEMPEENTVVNATFRYKA